MRTYLRLWVIVVVILGLGFLLPLGVAQPLNADPRTPPKAKPQLAVKVFKLQRAEPAAITQALDELLEFPDMEIVPPMPGGGPSIPPGGGLMGFGGVGIGGMGGLPTNTAPVWRATIDDRTKAVIVRGSEKHIKVAADLVAILDRPANAPMPELQAVKAFALKHADATGLVLVIEQLCFEDLRLSAPDEKLLVVLGPDEATKAIAELVKELDVPGKLPERTEQKK